MKIGDPVKNILDESKNFYIVSVSEPEPGRIKRFFSENIALNVMQNASISVINVR